MSTTKATRPASRPLQRTSTPGIYKRDDRYIVVFKDPSGRQRKRFARTLAEARRLKSELTADVQRGEYREQSRVTFAEHWQEWIESYAGRTNRGFREQTRHKYERDIETYALPFFGRMRLAEIERQHIKRWLHELSGRELTTSTVRNILAPLRAMLGDAADDGLIRANPAAGVRVQEGVTPPEQRPKALTERQVQMLFEHVPAEHQLLVQVVAETGARISEVIAWRWEDFDGKRLRVRRRLYRGDTAEPKSRHGIRAIPLRGSTAQALWRHRKATAWSGDEHPIFASEAGTPLDYANLYHRMLKPAMRSAGIEHGGWHRLRHTAATRLIEAGARPDQAQRWLGHHDLAFTMRTYVHPAEDDLPDPDKIWGSERKNGTVASDAVAEARWSGFGAG